MTDAEILESNKLIADFMGMKIGVDLYSWRPGSTCPLAEGHLNFHASWGWLMPVVEKISRIEFERRYDEDIEKWVIWTHHPVTFGMLDETGRPMVRFYCSTLHFGDTLIEAAYEAVVDFVKWQNEKK
jgi:hypothetical protein